MIDLKLSFDEESMLRLTNEQFKQLALTGETITDFAPAKDYWIDEEFSRLFLSFDNSLSNYHFCFEPQEDIDTFIQNAYLTHFFPKTGKIKLIKDFDLTLDELLPKKHVDLIDIPLINRLEFTEKQHSFSDQLNESAVGTLIKTGSFKGLISCCECGEEGCSSDYLWAQNNSGLVGFFILAAKLRAVELFPFRLT